MAVTEQEVAAIKSAIKGRLVKGRTVRSFYVDEPELRKDQERKYWFGLPTPIARVESPASPEQLGRIEQRVISVRRDIFARGTDALTEYGDEAEEEIGGERVEEEWACLYTVKWPATFEPNTQPIKDNYAEADMLPVTSQLETGGGSRLFLNLAHGRDRFILGLTYDHYFRMRLLFDYTQADQPGYLSYATHHLQIEDMNEEEATLAEFYMDRYLTDPKLKVS